MLAQHRLSVVPVGTGHRVDLLFPALKRGAILFRPAGLKPADAEPDLPSLARCIPKLSVTSGDAGWGHLAYNSERTPR